MKIYPFNFLFLTYIVLPTLIYSIILYFSFLIGEISFHWYITIYADSYDILKIWLINSILALFIFFVPKEITIGKKSSPAITLFAFISFIVFTFSSIGYFRVIALGSFIISIMIVGFNKRFLSVLVFFAILGVFLGLDRFPFVIPLILWLVSKPSTLKALFLYIFSGLLFLVFILTPIKSNQPIDEWLTGKNNLYLITHLNPIFVGAIYFNEQKSSSADVVLETIPFAKSISGNEGIINKLRDELDKINIEGDFGSNSSSLPLMMVFLLSLFTILVLLTRIQYIREIMILYLIIYSPYFLRRSFASYINEFIVIASLGICFFLISNFLRKVSDKSFKKMH